MDNFHLLCILIVPRPLDVNKGSFTPKNDNDEFIGPEVPCISVMNLLVPKYQTLVL